ncbi:MAG: hypothetical protein OEY44_02135, partial [Candidatus Peregrinibacteria bacterium]|nr:hypothetical protein [Candidatus Peregrinibacteria bacterium]
RYQILQSAGTEGSNQFHGNLNNYHAPTYSFANSTNPSGIYNVDGSFYADPEDEGPFDPVGIDRSDIISTVLTPVTPSDYAINLTPSQFVGEAITAEVSFDIQQYLGYKPNNSTFEQFALYEAPPKIDGIEVKNVGLGTSGVVGGSQVFEVVGGRDLETITTTSSADLRKEIRQNVAALTRTVTPCSLPAALTSLPTSGSCVTVDEVNSSIVAVYQGPGLLTLDSPGNLSVPAGYRYTLIILDGGNLAVESNIVYSDSASSFGMIVMQDTNGGGGNVYLDPAPTNIVGLLYAEGSLLSSPDGGTTLYYGLGGNAKDLKNQLFWQGSIASRNTIGGAPSRIVPDGVDCFGLTADSCAQVYDLDYTRRFIVLYDENNSVYYSPDGYLFSGGGTCNTTPVCSLGSLPTTVTLSAGTINQANSKSLDTFFIERDNRLVPPGFSSSGGLTSSQEIR